jgi:intraflagellar transport protein 172
MVCEKQNQWEEAAQLWYFQKQWERAAQACLKIDDISTAIKYYEEGGYYQQAEQYRALQE